MPELPNPEFPTPEIERLWHKFERHIYIDEGRIRKFSGSIVGEIVNELVEIGTMAIPTLIRIIPYFLPIRDDKFLDLFISSKQIAIPLLLPMLKDDKPYTRRKTVKLLGKIGDSGVVEPLIQCLNDPKKDVVISAIKALEILRDQRAIEPLIQCLNNPKEDVVISAIKTLEILRDQRAIEPLIHLLTHDDKWIRQRVASALSLFKDTRAINPLIDAMLDDNDEVAEAVIDALTRLMGDEVLIPLKMVMDTNPSILFAKRLILIGQKQHMDYLYDNLKDDSEFVREKAVSALAKIHDLDAVPKLTPLLNDSSMFVQLRTNSALSRFKTEEAKQAIEAYEKRFSS